MLNTVTNDGPEGVRPLLIVHGLFGSARNWGAIAKRLSDARPVLTVDMRNHGLSPRADTQSYADMAGDLAEVIAAHGGCCDVLGHSMGGKAAMVLAVTEPARVARLIVADIAPVAYGHSQMPVLEAMEALDLTGLTRRSEADARLAEIVDDRALRAFLLQSLNLAGDVPEWRLNLPVLRREMPKTMDFPELTGVYERPVLMLSGGASDYVKRDHRDRVLALLPAARFAKIPGAGHWLHAEKPREMEAAVRVFLGEGA